MESLLEHKFESLDGASGLLVLLLVIAIVALWFRDVSREDEFVIATALHKDTVIALTKEHKDECVRLSGEYNEALAASTSAVTECTTLLRIGVKR